MSTATPINLSPSQQTLIASIIKHSVKIYSHLHKAESNSTERELLSDVIKNISKTSTKEVQLLETFPEENIPKVLEKVKSILKKAVQLDSRNEAEYMLKQIEEAESQHSDKDRRKTASKEPSANESSPFSDGNDSIPFPWNDHDRAEINRKEAYEKLNKEQKDCLSFCCALLPHNRKASWVEISRRELIHWWMGLSFIDNHEQGEEVLARLVNDELWRSSSINSYIMHTSTLSRIEGVQVSLQRTSKSEKGVHRPVFMVQQKANFDGTTAEATEENIVVAINRGMDKLTDYELGKFFATKNVKILHLGSWPYDPTNNVVVEDIEALKSFLTRKWQIVTSLSLGGVAGIVILPESIYKITNLRVLDLKACPNLETMPKGIGSLKNLKHLDLSKCYLLDHIPLGIESLSQLQSLKGFIVNPPKHPAEQCKFKSLLNLKKLVNLDVHARVMNFPTNQDLVTLSKMERLKKLKVTWVLKTNNDNGESNESNHKDDDANINDTPLLPATLETLGLKAAPENTAIRVLDLINYGISGNCPRKLSISGGGLWKLDPIKYCFFNVDKLRLQYLCDLHMNWSDCRQLFPKLSHLEVFECPNLIFFPVDDNGMWDKSEQS
ncbi:Disease resistance RPP13-like protein 4 [Bienertia sinuspersici]